MSPRRKKLLKIMLIAVVVTTSAVFFFSSSFFLTKMVLPVVRTLTGVELYIGNIDWRPWSGSLTVKNFRLGSKDAPFLFIRKAHGYYDLRESLNGIISFSRLDGDGVDLHFILGEDGIWNFDKLAGQPAINLSLLANYGEPETPELFLPAEPAESPEEPDGAPEWLKFNIRSGTIRNSKLGLTTGNDKTRRHICWHDLNIGFDRFQNGSTSMVQSAGNIHFSSAQDLTLNTYASLSSNVTWGSTLMPDVTKLRLQLNALSGNMGSTPMDGSTLTIALNSTYKDDVFHFSRLHIDQTKLGDQKSSLVAKGQWHSETDAFSFDFPQAFLAPEPLALFFDLTFGINPGVLHFRGDGNMSYSHKAVSSSGHWTLTREKGLAVFGAERMKLPGFKIDSEQDFSIHSNPQSINFRRLMLTLSENDSPKPAIRLNLRNPVKYLLDKESFDGMYPGIDLTVDKLNLKLLRFMFPDREYLQFTGGVLSGTAGLDFAGNTGDSALHGTFRLDKAAFPAGKLKIDGLDAKLRLDSSLDRHGEIRLHRLNTELDYRSQKLAELSLSGRFSPDKKTSEMNLRTDDVRLNNPFFQFLPQLDILRRFPGLRTGISAVVHTSPDSVKIKNFSILASGDDNSRFSAIFQPQFFNLYSGGAVNDWQCEIEADLPLKYINAKDVTFNHGRLLVNGRVNAPSDMDSCTVDGSLQLLEAALQWKEIKAESVSLNNDFSCYFSDKNEIRLNAGYTYLRIAGHPALRGESRGSFNTLTGDGDLSLSVRYFNEQLINIFYPNLFDVLSGKGSVQFRREHGNTHLTSQIAAGKISRPGNKRMLSGDIQLELNGDKIQNSVILNCTLEEKSLRLASFRISGEEDIAGKEMKIAVNSDFIDGSLFAALSDTSDTQTEVPANNAPEPKKAEIQPTSPETLCSQKMEIQLNMENMHLSPKLQGALHGSLILAPDHAESRNLALFLNKTALPVQVRYSRSKGWHSEGALQGELDLAPVAEYFKAEYPLQCVLTGLNWNISAASLAGLLDNGALQGNLKGSMKNIAVENKAMQGPVMRIVMLPVEAVLRFNALIPNTADIRSHWRRLQETVLTGKNPLAHIRFDNGDFELHAENGKIEVDKLSFAGPLISKLDFTGDVTLNKDLPLALNSHMDMGGFVVNMPIKGALESPEVNISDLKLALAGAPLNKIIDKMTSAESDDKEKKSKEPEKKPETVTALPKTIPPVKPLWKRVILFWQE